MRNRTIYSLWTAIALSFCLCTVNAQEPKKSDDANSESKSDNQEQAGGGGLSGPSIMNSLMDMPDVSFDRSQIDAVRQQNQMNQQQRDAHIESVVRQEQRDPGLQKQRQRGSNKNATGVMTPHGPERDLENLTDAERIMSKEYVHEGRANRIYKEECGGENSYLCQGQKDPNAKGILGLGAGTMEMMAKAYTMMVGLGGGDFKKAEGKGAKGAEGTKSADNGGASQGGQSSEGGADSKGQGKGDDGSVSDYCKYIPVAVEGMAMMKQMSAQNDIQGMSSSSGSHQRDSLLKAAKSHDERAKQSKIQATGWTATTACYAGYGAIGGISMDWKYFVKLAGSGLFSWYYWDSVSRHEDDAEKTRAIAEKLPSEGDCNPVTDRLCYCSEESTRNDPDFCLPQMRDRYMDEMAEFTTPCIDSKGQSDIECQCRDTNSCFDREIEDGLRGVGFSTSDLQAMKPLQELSRGSLSTSGLNQAKQTNSALRNRIRKNFGKEIAELTNSKKLSPKQRAEVEELAKKGFPAPLAEVLSGAPMSSAAEQKLSEMKQGNFGPSQAGVAPTSDRSSGRKVRTKGGGGLNPGTQGGQESGDEFADMMKKLNGEDGREPASGKVLRFAERAQKAAQISKRKETFLFDIISHRYQKTAWKQFDVDFDALPELNE